MPPTFTDEGARAAVEIKERHPDIDVLVLSQHIDMAHAASLVAREGFGYLLKDRVLEADEFLATAQRVANGGSALDPKVVARLVSPAAGGPLTQLSERERDVLTLMAEGLTNLGIAHRLLVLERTVEAHVRHVLLKLDIPDSDDGHRRVLAVLAHLRAVHGADWDASAHPRSAGWSERERPACPMVTGRRQDRLTCPNEPAWVAVEHHGLVRMMTRPATRRTHEKAA